MTKQVHKDFTVREVSLKEFIAENGLGDKARNIENMSDTSHNNAAHNCYLMQDTLNFKIDNPAGIVAGQKVVITLSDEARGSRKQLVNTYVYKAHKHDDVTLKLKLEEFTVDLKKVTVEG